MTDPLSVTASAAGLASLGLQIATVIYDLVETYKDREKNVQRILQRVKDLQTIYGALEAVTSGSDPEVVSVIKSSLRSCCEKTQTLATECEKIIQPLAKAQSSSMTHVSTKLVMYTRRVGYPVKKKLLDTLETDIALIQADLALAFSTLVLQGQQVITREIKKHTKLLGVIFDSHTLVDVCQWLQIPKADVVIDYYKRDINRRSLGTGDWFLETTQFEQWHSGTESLIWLKGPPGCGKTVLCSTAIQSVSEILQHEPVAGSIQTLNPREGSVHNFGRAHYYFNHREATRSEEYGADMLGWLIIQLAKQSESAAAHLKIAYENRKLIGPSASQLQSILKDQIQGFDRVYLFFDAVDESSYGSARAHVLDILNTIRHWPGVCTLIASRDEVDISKVFGIEPRQIVSVSANLIAKDISIYIHEQLRTSVELTRRWHLYEQKIKQHLMAHANGSFRWVEGQLKALAGRAPTERDFQNWLQSPPESLDEMYERDLYNIGRGSADRVRRLLTMICFAVRPLSVREVIDALTVNMGEPSYVDDDSRLKSEEDLFELCPSLIEFYDLEPKEYWKFIAELEGLKTHRETFVRFRHESLKQYLQSAHCERAGARSFALSAETAHRELGGICLAYLLNQKFINFVLSHWGSYNLAAEHFPFAFYASSLWCHHLVQVKQISDTCKNLVHELFQDEEGDCFFAWKCFLWRAWNQDHRRNVPQAEPGSSLRFERNFPKIEILVGFPPTYETYMGGPNFGKLKGLRGSLLSRYDNIGQAAAKLDHFILVKTFFDHGSDVNLVDGRSGTILHAAADNKEIFEFLISNGSDINGREKDSETALHAAARSNFPNSFNTLLDMGADINVMSIESGTPLLAAAASNFPDRVKRLLEKDAEVNLIGGRLGTALIAAAHYGNEQVVDILLESGADVDLVASEYGTALQAATVHGHIKVVAALINKNANVNVLAGKEGSPLYTAVAWSETDIVRLLLSKGANPNLSVGRYRRPMDAARAIYEGVAKSRAKAQIIQLLSEAGAT